MLRPVTPASAACAQQLQSQQQRGGLVPTVSASALWPRQFSEGPPPVAQPQPPRIDWRESDAIVGDSHRRVGGSVKARPPGAPATLTSAAASGAAPPPPPPQIYPPQAVAAADHAVAIAMLGGGAGMMPEAMAAVAQGQLAAAYQQLAWASQSAVNSQALCATTPPPPPAVQEPAANQRAAEPKPRVAAAEPKSAEKSKKVKAKSPTVGAEGTDKKKGAPAAIFRVGESVKYYSSTHRLWLAAKVLRVRTASDGTLKAYDLDTKQMAAPNRVASATAQGAAPKTPAPKMRLKSRVVTAKVSAEADKVKKADKIQKPDKAEKAGRQVAGLAPTNGGTNGKAASAGPKTFPVGAQVSYFSTSANRWITTTVTGVKATAKGESFVYNLACKPGALPEHVRAVEASKPAKAGSAQAAPASQKKPGQEAAALGHVTVKVNGGSAQKKRPPPIPEAAPVGKEQEVPPQGAVKVKFNRGELVNPLAPPQKRTSSKQMTEEVAKRVQDVSRDACAAAPKEALKPRVAA